jgi:hypothetical protein
LAMAKQLSWPIWILKRNTFSRRVRN